MAQCTKCAQHPCPHEEAVARERARLTTDQGRGPAKSGYVEPGEGKTGDEEDE